MKSNVKGLIQLFQRAAVVPRYIFLCSAFAIKVVKSCNILIFKYHRQGIAPDCFSSFFLFFSFLVSTILESPFLYKKLIIHVGRTWKNIYRRLVKRRVVSFSINKSSRPEIATLLDTEGISWSPVRATNLPDKRNFGIALHNQLRLKPNFSQMSTKF